MQKVRKKSIAATALALCLLAGGCDRPPPHGSVRVGEATVRLPAVEGQPGSAYFALEAGSEGTRLLSVSSPLVRRIELHESKMEGSVSRMKRQKDVEFPPHGKLVFEPGGRHAMLFGINSAVKAGTKLPLTFAFNVAPPVTVDAEVRALGEEGHDGH
jgi:copper(I)-binding protein